MFDSGDIVRSHSQHLLLHTWSLFEIGVGEPVDSLVLHHWNRRVNLGCVEHAIQRPDHRVIKFIGVVTQARVGFLQQGAEAVERFNQRLGIQ